MNHDAIRALYPEVVTINGESDCFDSDGGGVVVDKVSVNAKAEELQARAFIIRQIDDLESQVTQRRLREAAPDDAGGSADGRAWLKAINDQINALRGG